ncbi:MAG TPA: hypothetical protein VFS11_02460 [Gemmatimonadales bacterium]|nr:hypothetical protein [Gemmatimonadales bacterium]
MIALPLLLQLATVGDTLWVRRTVAVPAGRELRAPEWQPSGEVEVIGRPRIVRRGDSVEIAWPVSVWAPGQHTVEVPGPALLAADGRVDSLPPEAVTLVVASVLPRVPPDSGLRPQPAAPAVPLHERSLVPVLVLLAAALLLLLPVHLLWRRRGRPVAVADASLEPAPTFPVERWAEWGETRAVVGAAVERLRAGIARRVPEAHESLEVEQVLATLAAQRPTWPLDELRDVFRALDGTRFAAAEPADAAALYRRAESLEARLPA